MKIRKTAWHYNFYNFSFEHGAHGAPEKTSLCLYFWRTVFGMFKILFIVVAVLVILFSIGAVIYNWPLASLGGGAVGAVCILTVHYWSRMRNYVNKTLYRTVDEVEEREPGLLRSYLKAKKDKICPLIEFVEEE